MNETPFCEMKLRPWIILLVLFAAGGAGLLILAGAGDGQAANVRLPLQPGESDGRTAHGATSPGSAVPVATGRAAARVSTSNPCGPDSQPCDPTRGTD